MKPVKLISVKPSKTKGKKYDAVFLYPDTTQRTVAFGAEGYSDFTIHKDEERKQRYITRHSPREEGLWKTRPDSPAALSRYLLWEEPTLQTAIRRYKERYSL